MTTEVIGQLPCPECNSPTDLKSDGRKHTLKCHHCGVLAYYQSQNAKAHIEQRLKDNRESALPTPTTNAITLQLPEQNEEGAQRYMLTIKPVNAQLATMDNDEPAANDEDSDEPSNNSEDDNEPPKKGGFFESFTEFL